MPLEYTPGLILALARAQRLAGSESVSQTHLLRGLLVEDEGQVARMVSDAGFDFARWRERHPGDVACAPAESTPSLSAGVRLALTQASQHVSHQSDEGSLATDQVLFALLAGFESVRDELAAAGFDAARFQGQHEHQMEALPIDDPVHFGQPDARPTWRILDAAANRAREALRVLEDYTRFVLDDALLSGELKSLRHELADALREIASELLLHQRDTIHDVGTQISTPQEGQRDGLAAVVQANAKRLQEALRTLEEFGKVSSPTLGQAMERLRYRSYTLERTLLLGQHVRERLATARLYVLVSESLCRASLVGTIREAAEGGADVIQLREKNLDDRTLLARAHEIRRLTRSLGVLFIVNDRIDIAMLADADGVHLGQDDVPLHEARRLAGPEMLLGTSTHDGGQLRRAVLEGASYVGVGPTFPSKTKDFAEFAGLQYVAEASRTTSLPAFVLGGVTLENLDEVLAAGGRRIAVSHAICGADDPRWSAREFKRRLS